MSTLATSITATVQNALDTKYQNESMQTSSLVGQKILAALDQTDSLKTIKEVVENTTPEVLEQNKIILNRALFKAVTLNKLAELAYMLSALPVSIEARNEDNQTMLMVACAKNTPEMVELLLKNKADLYAEDDLNNQEDDCSSPFLEAARHDRLDNIKVLLTHDPELINKQTSSGSTGILTAAEGGSLSALKYLISISNNPEAYKHENNLDENALVVAARQGHLEIVKYLIELDKEYFLDLLGDPLDETARCGQLEVLKYLISVSQETIDYSALFNLAASGGEKKILDYLLTVDPNCWKSNSNNSNSLSLAAANNHVEIMQFIYSLDPKYWNDKKRLRLAFKEAMTHGSLDALKCLYGMDPEIIKQFGMDISLRINGSSQPWRPALKSKDVALVQYLLSIGIAKTEEYQDNDDGVTRLVTALNMGDLKTMQELIANGVSVHANVSQGGLLRRAICGRQTEAALLFIKNGANINQKDSDDITPLMLALKLNQENVVVEAFKWRAEKISEAGLSPEETLSKQLILRSELIALIEQAEKLGFKLDYDYLALEFDKRYWLSFAKRWANTHFTDEQLAEGQVTAQQFEHYKQKKDLLSKQILARKIICKRIGDSIVFELSEKPGIEGETEAERNLRFEMALRYATEARNYLEMMSLFFMLSNTPIQFPELLGMKGKTLSFDDMLVNIAKKVANPLQDVSLNSAKPIVLTDPSAKVPDAIKSLDEEDDKLEQGDRKKVMELEQQRNATSMNQDSLVQNNPEKNLIFSTGSVLVSAKKSKNPSLDGDIVHLPNRR